MATASRTSSTQRRLLEAVDAPLPVDRLGLMPGGRVVITDDGSGVAAELACAPQAAGIPVERIGGPDQPVDWSSPSAIEFGRRADSCRRARSPGSSMPCRWVAPAPASARARLVGPHRRRGQGLFLLAKATAADLEHAARAGGSCLIAATAGGPVRQRRAAHPRLLSRLMAESPGWSRPWRANGRRSVAAWSTSLPMRHAETIAVAAGRRDLRQRRLSRSRLRGRPPDPACAPSRARSVHAEPALELKPGEPVLISGGARGITALVAAELARTWRPTLLIVGTTPLPERSEPAETAGLDRRSRDQGSPARPAAPRGPGRRARPRSNRLYQSITPCPGSPREPRDPARGRIDRGVCPGRRARPRGAGRRPRRAGAPATANPSA